jgi:hypothetical protein
MLRAAVRVRAAACPLRPCPFPMPRSLVMCAWHWAMVPPELASAVRLAFGPRELRAAQAAALAAVRRQVTANRRAPARSPWDDE